MIALPPSTTGRSNRSFFIAAGIVALAAAGLGVYLVHAWHVPTIWSGASGPCNSERCERVDLPSTIDVSQLLPKMRAAVLAVDRSAALVTYTSAGPIKNGQVDTVKASPTAFFRISSAQPGRNTIMATLYKGRIEMRWTDTPYDKPLPDPHCSGAKLTAAARAHGVAGDQGFFNYAYTMFPGGPGWSVSTMQPKPAVAMVSDRTCEPF